MNDKPRTIHCERQTANRQHPAGFTLIEVTVATSLLVVIALGSAQLFVLAVRQTVTARLQLVMTLAASRKVDELAAAGPLPTSPADALERGAEGFADVTVESGVTCVRRWAIAPLPGYAGRATAIVVRVSVAGAGDVQIVTIREGAAP